MGSAPGPHWRHSPQSPKVFPNTCYFPNLVCLDKKTWFLGAGSSWRGAASPYPPTRRSGEGCKLPSGVRAEPGGKLICVHYLAGKWSFVVTILISQLFLLSLTHHVKCHFHTILWNRCKPCFKIVRLQFIKWQTPHSEVIVTCRHPNIQRCAISVFLTKRNVRIFDALRRGEWEMYGYPPSQPTRGSGERHKVPSGILHGAARSGRNWIW